LIQARSFPHLPLAVKILLLALAYILAGRLALLLAIPPGFASAIFPPVGIALAAVLIWGYPMLVGVFLGSTLLNLSIGFSGFEALDLRALLIATGIALGTTLQSLFGSWLIRRYVGFPTALTDERSRGAAPGCDWRRARRSIPHRARV
jgi:integral membrane sensor domain MASE1